MTLPPEERKRERREDRWMGTSMVTVVKATPDAMPVFAGRAEVGRGAKEVT